MAVSLRSRVSLCCDHCLIGLVMSMSEKARTDGFEAKHLLKKAAQETILSEILRRKNKKGFPTPIGIWLEQQAKEVEEILLSENLYHPYFFCHRACPYQHACLPVSIQDLLACIS